MTKKSKRTSKISGGVLAAMIAFGCVSIAKADWVQGGMGSIPTNAIIGGNEANGQWLYICRANHGGGLHPGKIRREFSACVIPWG